MSTCRRCGGSGQEPDAREIGEDVRDARMDRGLSMRGLADETGVSAAYISMIEHGEGFPQGDGAKRVMAYLGVSGGEHG